MDQDAAYALIALGVLVGGGTIVRAGLDDVLDRDKAAQRAADKRAHEIPVTPLDKTVQFIVIAMSVGSLSMRLYDWYKTGKTPSVQDLT